MTGPSRRLAPGVATEKWDLGNIAIPYATTEDGRQGSSTDDYENLTLQVKIYHLNWKSSKSRGQSSDENRKTQGKTEAKSRKRSCKYSNWWERSCEDWEDTVRCHAMTVTTDCKQCKYKITQRCECFQAFCSSSLAFQKRWPGAGVSACEG